MNSSFSVIPHTLAMRSQSEIVSGASKRARTNQ
nr:MAG TPA: hypothetical protein [Caudoviricetes sp.]